MQEVTRAGANIALVVTGDSHHYAHYVTYSRDGGEGKNELAEAPLRHRGRGGAFPARHSRATREDPTAHVPQTRPTSKRASSGGARCFPQGRRIPGPDPRQHSELPLQELAVRRGVVRALVLPRRPRSGATGADRCCSAFTTQIASCALQRGPRPHPSPTRHLRDRAGVRRHRPARVSPQHVERDATRFDSEPFEWRQLADVALWVVAGGSLFALTSAGEPSLLGALFDVLPRNPIAALIVLLVPLASALYVSRPFEKTWALVGRLLFGLWRRLALPHELAPHRLAVREDRHGALALGHRHGRARRDGEHVALRRLPLVRRSVRARS